MIDVICSKCGCPSHCKDVCTKCIDGDLSKRPETVICEKCHCEKCN